METKQHPRRIEVIDAIKEMRLWNDPRTYFESELSNCYEDDDLVANFGWNGEKPNTPKQAVKAVLKLCKTRQSVFGWIVDEGDAERENNL